MTEDRKKEMATFRFGVIHELVSRRDMDRGEQERLIEEKCSRRWSIPHSHKTRIGRTTVLRWVKAYKKSGGKIESLYPLDRADRGQSRSMDEETVLSLLNLRQEFPRAPIKVLMQKMHDRNLVGTGVTLNASSIYRLLHQKGLMHPEGQKAEDRRKFEAELPNDIWQSDALHGPAALVEGKWRKTYLIALMDDHSRLIVHGEFYLSEGLDCFLEGFEKALLKRGVPRRLYVDNGSAYRSHHLDYVCASLGIALIHARPYKPQGKGKIERHFRSVRQEVLAGHEPGSLEALNETYRKWLQDVYHERKHRSTGESPLARFTSMMECMRPAPVNLQDHFRKVARRRVSRDRTLTLDGKLYEAPVCLIGKQVELLYHQRDRDRVEVRYNGESHGYVPVVDLHVNSRVKRDRNSHPQVNPSGQSPYRGGCLWTSMREEES